jgi:PAS domain S-box-containing protein
MTFVATPKRRWLPFSAALAVAAVMFLSVAVFLALWKFENQTARASFEIVAQERFDSLQTNVTLTLNSLVSLGAFFDGSVEVERDEFRRFAKDLLARDGAIQALEWIPRTPSRRRADRENAAHRDGFTAFAITERLPQGGLVRARAREEYFPVFYVEPLKGNEKALGFDLASDPVRNASLRSSAATGKLVATSRVKLVQEIGDQYGFLVFRPVFRDGVLPASVPERRERLLGFALAVFRVGDIVAKTETEHAASGLHVVIFDAGAGAGERLLYPKSAPFDGVQDLPNGFRAMREISVGGRRWLIAAYPSQPAFRPAHWSSWSALATGMLLAILLGGYLRLNRSRRLAIEKARERLEDLVQLRTTALEAKEHQLRLLLESTAEAIYGIDLQGCCTFCNPACLRLLGYENAEAVLGKNMHVLIHHSQADGTPYLEQECRIFRAFRRGEGTHVTDEVFWRANGSCFPAEYWSHPQRNGSEVVGAVVTFFDITESRQAEEKLRLAQASVEQASDAVFWLDSQGRILLVNAAACRSLARTREELLALSISDIVPEFTPEAWAAEWENVKARGSVTYETHYKTGQGKIFPVEVSRTYVEFGGSEYIFTFARDITERKRIENELRESEDYVTALLAAIPAGVVVIDSESHRVTDVNSSALRLMGRERDEVIGNVCHNLLCPADMGKCPIVDLHQEVDHSERVLLRADGSRLPILKSARALVCQGRTYLVEAFADLSDQKRTQMDLQKAKEAAEAAGRAKSAFLANMSHEIRTPMNAILGYSQLMLRDPSLGGAAKKNLNIINRSGEHLLGLIDDILVMSKIEAGRMELVSVAFDLATFVRDLATMFQLRAEAKGLQLEVCLDAEAGCCIVADQGKLRQVLINLLGNAVKFTETGGIKLRVCAKPNSRERSTLSIEVEDTGIGIPAAEQSMLFRPFVQTQSGISSHSGTGLGLAISKEFVGLMGGDITIVSEPGKGSIFRFEIPVQRDAGSQITERPLSGRVIGLAAGQPAPRVLVVDDKPNARGWLTELLRSLGFEVDEADRGEVAIRLWQEWKPQLILMDIRMPGMSGLAAAQTIKAKAAENPPVIIALTASAVDEERDAVMGAVGIDDFLAKPCREGDLLETIRIHLNLDYRYADEADAGGITSGVPAPTIMGDELLGDLPAEWVAAMHDAVLKGDKDRLDQLILRVEGMYPRAARGLQEVADRYEYDVLTRWFEKTADARMERQAERQ